MTNLFDYADEKPTPPPEPWTVSALANAIKRTLEGEFGSVSVRGELGRVTKHSSGHIYFDIKDDASVVHAVWFKNAQKTTQQNPAILSALAQGAEVVLRGRLSSYPARSEYQLIVTHVELAGVGALLKLIEERKKKLAAEGLFDADRKKPLPYLPRVIGVITSPTGAVIQDILHRLRDRMMPHLILWPTPVQGETAAQRITRALEGFQNEISPRPDVIIVARGGGSVEDLMPFNDEELVRAVASCSIPVISAVGHETDWTLIDYAADMRAPTPTGAAEMAVPVKADLVYTLRQTQTRLDQAIRTAMLQRRTRLEALHRALVHPRTLIENRMQTLDEKGLRLSHALKQWLNVHHLRLARLTLPPPHNKIAQQKERLMSFSFRLSPEMIRREIDRHRQRLSALSRTLDALSYERTLERGFALALSPTGKPVSRAHEAPPVMTLRFYDGDVRVEQTPPPQ